MKPLVIYHGNCADGFAAACVFKNYGDREYDFFPGVYQQAPPDCAGRDVYLVDFSYKRAVVEEILKVATRVVLIDHHKSAIEDLQPLIDERRIEALVDIEHSGAMLAWIWFHGNFAEPPQLLKHIEDRDLWRFALPGTREVQAALFSYPYDFEVWTRLFDSFDEAGASEMFVEGAAIERKHHKDIAELLKVCQREMVIGGETVPVASLPYTLVSDAGHIMAKGKPFAACYWDTEKTRIFGLRSCEGGSDVSEVAKQYGGGGHKNAAGFSVPRDHELARS